MCEDVAIAHLAYQDGLLNHDEFKTILALAEDFVKLNILNRRGHCRLEFYETIHKA